MKIFNEVSTRLKSSNFGRELLFKYKSFTNKLPNPDLFFSELISIEVTSVCNLSCIHCPPHLAKYKNEVRKFGFIELELFENLMDQIDRYGMRNIALHKDGEPLIHPKMDLILNRVKKNRNHTVYLTTNAHFLTKELSETIISNRIDVINFSIGAATDEFYSKVRGKNFNKVIDNIIYFLKLRENAEFKSKVLVQIINLPQFPEMKEEIKKFYNFWKLYDVEIQEWKNLSWGVYDVKNTIKRYPCFSLWESIFINSDGNVSACCMDWKQKLLTGNAKHNSIKEIWQGKEINTLRKKHVEDKENELPICPTCNYWCWQPKLKDYPFKLN